MIHYSGPLGEWYDDLVTVGEGLAVGALATTGVGLAVAPLAVGAVESAKGELEKSGGTVDIQSAVARLNAYGPEALLDPELNVLIAAAKDPGGFVGQLATAAGFQGGAELGRLNGEWIARRDPAARQAAQDAFQAAADAANAAQALVQAQMDLQAAQAKHEQMLADYNAFLSTKPLYQQLDWRAQDRFGQGPRMSAEAVQALQDAQAAADAAAKAAADAKAKADAAAAKAANAAKAGRPLTPKSIVPGISNPVALGAATVGLAAAWKLGLLARVLPFLR